MAVTTTGLVRIEPFRGGLQPTPHFASIASTESVGDGTGGSNTTVYTISAELLWIPRLFWIMSSASAGEDVDVRMETELEGIRADSFPLPGGRSRAGAVREWPRELIRSGSAPVMRFSAANVNAVTITSGFRWYGFPKTVLRDFSAAQLLGFVL